MSALSSFRCAGWLLPNKLPMLLAFLPFLCLPMPSSHWHHFCCCAGIFAIVAADTALIHCRHQTNLCHPSLFWLIFVFATHYHSGAADDNKWCGMAEDDNAYQQSAAAEDDATYPCGGEAKEDDAAYRHGGAAKDDVTYRRGGAANNNAAKRYGGTIDNNDAYGRSGAAEDGKAGCLSCKFWHF